MRHAASILALAFALFADIPANAQEPNPVDCIDRLIGEELGSFIYNDYLAKIDASEPGFLKQPEVRRQLVEATKRCASEFSDDQETLSLITFGGVGVHLHRQSTALLTRIGFDAKQLDDLFGPPLSQMRLKMKDIWEIDFPDELRPQALTLLAEIGAKGGWDDDYATVVFTAHIAGLTGTLAADQALERAANADSAAP